MLDYTQRHCLYFKNHPTMIVYVTYKIPYHTHILNKMYHATPNMCSLNYFEYIAIFESVCLSFPRYTRRRLWSARNQIWQTHADSSPNGRELNTNQLRVIPKGGLGGLGGQKFKNLE